MTLVGRISIRKVESGAGEGVQTRYYTQLVLDSYQKNDRSNTKRHSGMGNGAVKGSHPFQSTSSDRFDNSLQPEVGEGEELPL